MQTVARNPAARLVSLFQCNKQVAYPTALQWQRTCQTMLIEARKLQTPLPVTGSIFLLEHEPVYTLGRGSKEEFILDKSISVVRVERGGEVTFHGPGQLVGYVVLDLEHYKKDLHWMVRNVEECIIRTIGQYRIQGERISGKTGVWVGKSKVAAIGLSAKQWVTMHGFALNISPGCLSGFNGIVPCGIKRDEGSVTCMSSLLDKPDLLVRDVRSTMTESLRTVFDLEFQDKGTSLKEVHNAVEAFF